LTQLWGVRYSAIHLSIE